jgi:DNA-binding response OmpR family regulator
MNKHIALIRTDPAYLKFLKDLLTEQGYKITTYDSELEFLEKIDTAQPDLIISGYHLSNLEGESFYKQIYKDYPTLPLIFVSNERDTSTIANILKHPTADFMVKPIATEELLARIRVNLKMETEVKDPEKTFLAVKDLVLDYTTMTVKRGKKELILTPTEFKLLDYLMTNKNQVLSRDRILQRIWGTDGDISYRIVDVYIGYLRKKIDDGSKNPLIKTLPGFGYTIRDSG